MSEFLKVNTFAWGNPMTGSIMLYYLDQNVTNVVICYQNQKTEAALNTYID